MKMHLHFLYQVNNLIALINSSDTKYHETDILKFPVSLERKL